VFVTPETVRNFGLRDGLWVKAETRMGGRGPQLTKILDINGRDPELVRTLPWFEELKAVNPDRRMQLETEEDRMTTRIIDLIAPVGRGQRGLIVSPPRSGKTTILQHMAEAVIKNHSGVKVMVLLVDERPEEVTELRRALPEAEIYASSNDMEVKMHCRIAQMAVERAKRLVEAGDDVFMLMDSITRLARAFNNASKKGGPTGTGGLTVRALEMPRKLFAAARNTRDAGSLTIIATALVETNSVMDDRIFEELKGTGNMELVLDRAIAEQYIYPAVDIFRSGTRREELLIPPHQWQKISTIRRALAGHRPVEAIERLISIMGQYPGNAQMLLSLKLQDY
jgi:transcription termination factor Rho